MNSLKGFAGLVFLMAVSALCAGCHISIKNGSISTGSRKSSERADPPTIESSPGMARGFVYLDKNNNRKRDPGEQGIAGIRVSNGDQITMTDKWGSYQLPVTDDTIIFVIKPRGYRTPLDHHNLPRFYYIHKPNGSPDLRYGGVEPTGPLPKQVNFPLYKQREPDSFRALLFADPQTRDVKEIDYMRRDVIEQLVGADASFGVTLGDIVYDDLSIYNEMTATVALIGIPWYNVIGNHDINFDAEHDHHSDETFERHFGPAYYSFDYGPAHFIVLDDVMWKGPIGSEGAGYTGGLGERQMSFIKNDLAGIPADQPVVLFMHIPLVDVEDRHELYQMIQQRPMCMSVCGHTHYMEHRFIGEEDGWKGPEPHHHVICVTVSGSWWGGKPDERGVPHTMMRKGAPNGYMFLNFKDGEYSTVFRAASRPASHQMNIDIPQMLARDKVGETVFYVNIFGGSSKSTVEFKPQWSDQWMPMEKTVEIDPRFRRIAEEEAKTSDGSYSPVRPPRESDTSDHLWKATLPPIASNGQYTLQVRTRDMDGHEYEATRLLTVNRDGGPYGVRMTVVVADSQADKLGIKVGDVVVEFGGQRTRNTAEFISVLRGNTDGKDLPLVIERGEERIEVTLKPGQIGINIADHYRE